MLGLTQERRPSAQKEAAAGAVLAGVACCAKGGRYCYGPRTRSTGHMDPVSGEDMVSSLLSPINVELLVSDAVQEAEGGKEDTSSC